MEPTGTIFGALSLKCYTGGCAGPTHAIARLGEPSVTHPLLQAPKSQFGQVSHLSPSTMCRDQTATGVGEHPQIPSGAGVKQQLGSVSTWTTLPVSRQAATMLGRRVPWTPPLPCESQTSAGLGKSPESCPHYVAAKPPSAQIGAEAPPTSDWITSGTDKWLKPALSTQRPSHNRVSKRHDSCPPQAVATAVSQLVSSRSPHKRCP